MKPVDIESTEVLTYFFLFVSKPTVPRPSRAGP